MLILFEVFTQELKTNSCRTCFFYVKAFATLMLVKKRGVGVEDTRFLRVILSRFVSNQAYIIMYCSFVRLNVRTGAGSLSILHTVAKTRASYFVWQSLYYLLVWFYAFRSLILVMIVNSKCNLISVIRHINYYLIFKSIRLSFSL